MLPKPIGILGGAGPLAGALLLQRVLRFAQKRYSCCADRDYPLVILFSLPFADMLSPDFCPLQVQEQLKRGLEQLRANGASILAIACNTLYTFLQEEEKGLVHILTPLANQLPPLPLVLCTSTAVKRALHKDFFACRYPLPKEQALVDEAIGLILRGDEEQAATLLAPYLASLNGDSVVLGCTELSLIASRLASPNLSLLDPLDALAQELVTLSFKEIQPWTA
jgi:aspartate racemase